MAEEPFLPPGYAEALGWATIAWAQAELALDLLVAVTFHMYGGHLKHREIPRSLSRKVEYLRDVAKQGTVGEEWAGKLVAAADAAHDLKEERHDAVHGALIGEIDGEMVSIMRILYEKTVHRESHKKVSVRSLKGLTARTRAATSSTLDITYAMFDALDHPVNKPIGEAGA
jgi:hypothetical protein